MEKKKKRRGLRITLIALAIVIVGVCFALSYKPKASASIITMNNQTVSLSNSDSLYRVVFYKGRHYPVPLTEIALPQFFSLEYDTVQVSSEIVFHPNTAYTFDDADQWDWNKLCGFSLGLRGIHKNSFRFGWRYNPNTEKIELSGYIYTNSNRSYPKLMDIDLGEKARLDIIAISKSGHLDVEFFINGTSMHRINYFTDEYRQNTVMLIYESGLYFGGDKPAPHNIDIDFRMDMFKPQYK